LVSHFIFPMWKELVFTLSKSPVIELIIHQGLFNECFSAGPTSPHDGPVSTNKPFVSPRYRLKYYFQPCGSLGGCKDENLMIPSLKGGSKCPIQMNSKPPYRVGRVRAGIFVQHTPFLNFLHSVFWISLLSFIWVSRYHIYRPPYPKNRSK
jgi:hypothetical protein